MIAVTATAEFNGKFLNSFSPETVRLVSRVPGLNRCSADRKSSVSAKNRNLRLSVAAFLRLLVF